MTVSKRIINLETESAFTILEKANKLSSEGKDIINLGIGQPDFPTPINIQEAAIKAIKDGYHGYTPSNGILILREAISEMIQKDYSVIIDPDNILITPGGKPVIFFSSLIFGGKENEIIYPDPGFPIYKSMIKYSGAKAVPIKLKEKNNFEIDLNDLEKLISNKTSLIIINNPNNPTGSFMNKDKIDNLVNILNKYPRTYVLSDEIYSKIIFDGQTMPSLINYPSLRERLIILEGWSKTFCMTGWRLGWSIWPNKIIDYANKLCVNDHSCPSSISQYAGLEAIKGPKDEVNKIVKEFQNRKNFIYKNLNKIKNISCFEPGGAFYAFPNISKTGLNGSKFAEIALNEKYVAVVPGNSFGESANDFIRISFANSLENIEKALYRLAKI
ncbi:MAG: Aspartate aminotransferase [Alphaproteobacteria bacterium MarineAlpha5_Bin5]|nr:MAG: Aspartate aminotransferase [Alphaproteobacteria bacterium MarineAlpha5_Bin4]PPR50366.1 MAG: Aspartate aminotransferase [Alphaproteobacteria bacterium MarineAlpha5_Bin5]|tara:strand:+ start:6407 stop:7564 length:1158 start_codon:yes stop_codon:yes gene_type:complete